MMREGSDITDAVARVCVNAPGIRARLERAGDTSPLDRLIAAVRNGGKVAERLDELPCRAAAVWGRARRVRAHPAQQRVWQRAPRGYG